MIPKPTLQWAETSDEAEFEAGLARHIGAGTGEMRPLLTEQNLERTHNALRKFKRRLELELLDLNNERADFQTQCYKQGHWGKEKWFAAEPDFRARRSDLTRRKMQVEDALSIVSARVKKVRQEFSDNKFHNKSNGEREEVAMLRGALEKLTIAISEHQESIEYGGGESSVPDRALWATLARVHLPTRGGRITLREWAARTLT